LDGERLREPTFCASKILIFEAIRWFIFVITIQSQSFRLFLIIAAKGVKRQNKAK
jgi:hypothetical protein